jgi:hypothetical protein
MRTAFLSGLMACCVSALDAQQPAASIRGPAASILFAAHSPIAGDATAADTTAPAIRPTHWKSGLLLGGSIGAFGLGAFLYSFCEGMKETRESCVPAGLAGAAIGAVIGGTVGALIGGQIPKTDSLPAADSTAPSP